MICCLMSSAEALFGCARAFELSSKAMTIIDRKMFNGFILLERDKTLAQSLAF